MDWVRRTGIGCVARSRWAVPCWVPFLAAIVISGFLMSGCGLYSYMESGTVAATPRSPLVHLPRPSDSTNLQGSLALQGFGPWKWEVQPRFSRQGQLTLEQPISTEWDPLVASGEISWFVRRGRSSRVFMGGDLVHELKAFWIGMSSENPFQTPVPVEIGFELGKTKVVQMSQWENLEIDALGRSYDKPFKSASASRSMEWFWRVMVSAAPRKGGPWGGLELGVHPAVRNLEGNVGYFSLVAAGLGWFWRTPYGRIGTTTHLVLIDDRICGSIRVQGVADFGWKSPPIPSREPVLPTEQNERNPKPIEWPVKSDDWPEAMERSDSSTSRTNKP